MGDRRRFNVLADFVARNVRRRDLRVADVAAGKGQLTLALKERGFTDIDPWEPKPRKTRYRKLIAKPFTLADAKGYDLLIGLHPDGATEEIVCGAAKYDVPMIVVPCCAIASRTANWGGNCWKRWLDHVLRLCHKHGLETRRTALRFQGRNQVIWTPGLP